MKVSVPLLPSWVTELALSQAAIMSTPRDAAVLHAIFHPNAPFGFTEEREESEEPESPDTGCGSASPVQMEARGLDLLGVKAAESGDLTAALQNFTRAIELLPDFASAYNNRAQVRRLQGDVTGALEDLELAVELSGGKGTAGSQALVQRGLILRLQGKEDEALQDFRRAADQGSEFAKKQLVILNPYAALCNNMLRSMIQKLQQPDSHPN